MSLFNEPLLLVPIHLDALVVGTQTPPATIFQWTNLSPNFSMGGNYFFGSELQGDNPGAGTPFDQSMPLATGIHLLFQLPRAFSHGQQNDDGPLTFPAIPNRWLVQRFGGGTDYRACLIQSDVSPEDSSGVPWPVFPHDEQTQVEFGTIGSCAELTGPLPDGDEPALIKLTVVGQGDPLFAVYYSACRSVLGFHDPLAGVPTGVTLSYLVTGWFSDSTDDPLYAPAWATGQVSDDHLKAFKLKQRISDGASLTTDQQAQMLAELRDAWFAERQWKCSFASNAAVPSRLLCHGVVRGVSWQGENCNYVQPSTTGSSLSMPEVFPPNPDTTKTAYQVSIGNSGGEALAAGLAKSAVDQDLLAALQDGLMGQPISAAELQYELHARRFHAIQGGTVFAIQPEPEYAPLTGANDLNSAAQPVLPKPLADLLRDLNEKQSECDRLSRFAEDCRWQVYALWYLWTTEFRQNGNSDRAVDLNEQLDSFKQVLDETRTNLDLAINARNQICNTRDSGTSTGTIINELMQYPKTNADGSTRLSDAGVPLLKYRLVKSTSPPFYEPNEPVIAISGPAMARRNTAERSGPITCRVSDQIVTGMTLQIPAGQNVTVQSNDLLTKLFPHRATLQFLNPVHQSLLAEALMLDTQQAANIASQASAQFAGKLTDIVKALQDPTSTAAQSNPPKPPNALVGSPPDAIAIFNWQRNPWIPLVMVWEATWQPSYETSPGQLLPDDLVVNRWTLDSTGDLVGRYDATPVASATYRGYSILSPSASLSLAGRLGQLNDANPFIPILDNQNSQLQKLAGFNAALIRKQAGMQIPPLNYQTWFDGSDNPFLIDPIRGFLNRGFAVADQRERFRPAPATGAVPFLPIRSGQLEITRLSIVDAFGQTLLLPLDDINQSAADDESMLRAIHTFEAASKGDSAIALQPRFAQPMRLQFATSSVASESGSSPVCGWVLPNHLEKSLTIYDTSGKPLGALQMKLGQVSGTTDPSAFYWVDVPGGANGAAMDLDARLTILIENAHLRFFCNWVLGLNPDSGADFSSLINQAIDSTDQRVPDDDPGVSVLVGRPLALVRASLELEMAGLAAHQLELRSDTGRSAMDLIDTAGFERVKWPVRLGDFTANNDGLIGFFKCVPGESGGDLVSQGPLYPSWGQDQGLLSAEFAGQDCAIDCVQPLEVTMLMDPQTRVHATTGALPRTFFQLPHDTIVGAKRVREVFLQTAPVLGFMSTPAMPRPSDDYGEWTWAYRPDVTHWKLDPQLIEATYLGGFNGAWPTISEGWLKLAIAPVKVLSFWIREPVNQVIKGSRIHLAWSLQGAESLELVIVKGTNLETVAQWEAPPFPSDYGIQIDVATTYRVIASTADGKSDSKELTIKIAPKIS